MYRASPTVHTGLANTRLVMTRLGQRRAAPRRPRPWSGVLFCDIDNLKPVNDRYGHLVGDAVISTVANRLERAVRRQDVVARVGGDEFVIVLDHCQTLEELTIVARNVETAASHPVETSAGPGGMSPITVGAVLAASTADTDQALGLGRSGPLPRQGRGPQPVHRRGTGGILDSPTRRRASGPDSEMSGNGAVCSGRGLRDLRCRHRNCRGDSGECA